MAPPQRLKSQRLPPPILGENQKDPIAEMNPLYALHLENFIAANGAVWLRNGYRYHAKTIGTGAVKTIGVLDYYGTNKLIGVGTNGKVYDATTASAAGTDISGAVTLTSSFAYITQFRDRIFIRTDNSGDLMYRWTGSGNIAAASFVGPGGGDTRLGPGGVYRNRIYFPETSGNPSIWYSGVDSVTGTLTEFPLASVLQKGFTTINFVGSVSRSKQAAEQELFCIITDMGEVLVYQGDYPGHATWSIVHRSQIPRPASIRGAFFYVGSSLYVMTENSTISMRDVLSGQGVSGIYPSLSENIDPTMTTELQTFPLNGYAQGISYPRGQYILLNVPRTSSPDTSKQWCMSTSRQPYAWSRFTGQNAYNWAVFSQALYFGGTDGRIFKADNGYFDENPASEGAVQNRTIKMRQAYNYFGDESKKKSFQIAVPFIYQSEGLALTMDMNVDFEDTTVTSSQSDTTDTAYKIYKLQMGLTGEGYAGSLRIDGTVSTKRISLQATQVLWEDADVV